MKVFDDDRRAVELRNQLLSAELSSRYDSVGRCILAHELGEYCRSAGLPVEQAISSLVSGIGTEQQDVLVPVIAELTRGFYAPAPKLDDHSVEQPFSNSLARLTALHRISQSATESLDLEAMLNTVVSVVRETIAADACSILLYDQSNDTLNLRATVGLIPDFDRHVSLPLGTGITGEAAVRRQTMAVTEATSHPSYLDYPPMGDRSFQSQVSVPLALRSPDRLVGVLNIFELEKRAFHEEELAFLETVGGEISVAIENARLYSETDAELRRRIRQLSTLRQVSRLVASTLDLEPLLALISEQTVELSAASAAEIYRYPPGDEAQPALISRSSLLPDAVLDSLSDQVHNVVHEVIDTGVTFWRHLTAEGQDLYLHALPMLTGRRAVGAICIYTLEHPDVGEQRFGLLHAFSDSAAIAIENAELYEETRRGLRQTSTLLQEMHHRVRNNLQTVAALLSMQARHAGDGSAAHVLREAVLRIRSIAAIHDLLSSGGIGETTVDVIAKHVADEAGANLLTPGDTVHFEIVPSDVMVSSREATIVALLINEFISNAIYHGFNQPGEHRIRISCQLEGSNAVLEIVDTGSGVDDDFSLSGSTGLGLQIARTLAEGDLRGSLTLRNSEAGGTIVRVVFQGEKQRSLDCSDGNNV